MKVVEGVRQVLHKTVEMVIEQIRLLRKAAFNLKKELQDKDASLDIDEHAQNLTEHRSEVQRQARLLVSDENE